MKIKLICWTCKKEYEDVPLTGPYKCECGGYVVSPSGKVQGKWVDEDEKVKDSDSPTESSAERVSVNPYDGFYVDTAKCTFYSKFGKPLMTYHDPAFAEYVENLLLSINAAEKEESKL